MRDISRKTITLRTAKAVAVVLCKEETLARIKADQLPKGDLLNIGKAAGLLGAKQTQSLIPHCHPVSIDGFTITYEYLEDSNVPEGLESLKGKYGVVIYGEGKSIGRTGIEMEVLTGISVSALTIYDLLKPIDKSIEITSIKLLNKTGGKSDRLKFYEKKHSFAVLVCSDSVSAGSKEDRSGKEIETLCKQYNAELKDYQVVPDNIEQIQAKITQWVNEDIHFIFTTGGTGLSPKDYSIEAIKPLLEKDAAGIAEAMRQHGGLRSPVAMFSRSLAGSIGKSTIVCLPGSTKGVQESLDAILPTVFHCRHILEGGGH